MSRRLENSALAVLVIDDRAENRRLYSAMLKGMSTEIEMAASGEEAIALCREREYAAILLDVHLPGMSGFEAARRMRELKCCRFTPIVFISAVFIRESDAFRGYGEGAVDYLIAPVVPEILRAKVQVFIDLLRLRRALEATNCELRHANAELDAFSYSAAHDLKSPIHHIDGYAEVLLKRHAGALDADARHYLERIVASCKHLGHLIDDLLMLARITQAGLKKSEVDLSELAEGILRALALTTPERKVSFIVMPGLKASADAGLARILLTNLLGNAWKFTGKRSEGHVEFGAREEQGETIYFVRDDGAGFAPEETSGKLFRAFQRFHDDENFPGHGVGLATVERIVKKHGGRVWAEGQPDAGACFYFTLAPAAES